MSKFIAVATRAEFPTSLIAAKSLADNDYSFAAPEGHFARVTFSTRYSANDCKQLASSIAALPDLLAALEEMCATFKPFRTRPVGGEGSAARLDQENQIAVHNAAMKAIAAVKGGAA